MKIWKLEQLKQQTHLDEMVLTKAEEILKVLNVHYGDERLVTDLGGYILWIQDSDKEELKAFFNQYPTLVPEYVEIITSYQSSQFVEMLFLLSSDNSVVVYCDYEMIEEYPFIMSELNINE